MVERMPEVSGVQPELFEELYATFFEGKSIGVERYIQGDLKESRREDIDDSNQRFGDRIDALFPDLDDQTKRKILATCVFFERIGCESGIVFAASQGARNNSDAAFRQRITEYGFR